MVFSIIVGDREGKGTDQLTPLARKAGPLNSAKPSRIKLLRHSL